MAGTNFIPLLAVYAGDALGNLSLVASNNFVACYEHAECGCHWRERSQITFHVARGQSYQVGVDSAIVVDSALTFSWTSHQLDFITNFVNTPVQPGNPITTGTANGSLTPGVDRDADHQHSRRRRFAVGIPIPARTGQ